MKIKEYLEKNNLVHPGGRIKRCLSKAEIAKKRKLMKEYWRYKDTTFDE